jgi:hypothetical protein
VITENAAIMAIAVTPMLTHPAHGEFAYDYDDYDNNPVTSGTGTTVA